MNIDDFKENIWVKNPILVYVLGLALITAYTTSLDEALIIGLLTTITILISNTFERISQEPRVTVVSAIALTTIYSIIFQIHDIYVLLIGVSSIVLAKTKSNFDAFGRGIAFSIIAVILSICRELLGAGSLTIFNQQIISGIPHTDILLTPGAGVILLGILIAIQRRWKT